MKMGDLAELAARNLREAVLRNSLTTLGISVGVASLVALLSLGVGLQQDSGEESGSFRAGEFRERAVLPESEQQLFLRGVGLEMFLAELGDGLGADASHEIEQSWKVARQGSSIGDGVCLDVFGNGFLKLSEFAVET